VSISDQDTDAAVAAGLAQCRKQIGGVVRPYIAQYAAKINLPCGKQKEFEQDIIEALLWCVVSHVDEPKRKRFSDIRKDWLHVGKEAAAAEKHLKRLRSALNNLPPQYRELLNAHVESAEIAAGLIAKQAGDIGGALKGKDKGGTPSMLSFRSLIIGLKKAFERATGSPAKVTWNEHRSRYEGLFVSLVEAVLPLALSCGDANRPMRIPSSEHARGKYVHQMTRRARPKRAMPET
jgi:hypothetical protein